MATAVVCTALLFWAGVFMVYFTAQGTTPLEFFLGRYEPLPTDLGIWKQVGQGEDGLLREERWVLLDAAKPSFLLHQVRYRDSVSRAIVRVEPERRVRRRRVSGRRRDQ